MRLGYMNSILILNDFLINKTWKDRHLSRFSDLNHLKSNSFLDLKAKFLFLKNITHPVNCHDIARVSGIFLNFFTEMGNVNMDMFHTAPIFISPYIDQDLFKREQFASVPGQIHQQTEFDRS